MATFHRKSIFIVSAVVAMTLSACDNGNRNAAGAVVAPPPPPPPPPTAPANPVVYMVMDETLGEVRSLQLVDPLTPGTSVQVNSALDWVLTPLRTRLEKTYSAPLATRLYQKESVEQADGSTVREFPRLAHGGRHLKDESGWGADIALRIVIGLAEELG